MFIERAGEVARPVVKQQAFDTLIGEGYIQRRQIARFGFQHDFHRRAVGIAKEPIVQLGVDVFGRHERLGFGIDRHHFLPHLRIRPQQLGILQTALNGDPQPVGILRAQGIGLSQHRTFIEMHQLDRRRRQIAKLGARGVKPLAQGIGIQFQQRRHIARQIDHNHRIAVFRMPGQGRHQAGVAARCAKHAGDMHQGLHLRHVDKRRQLALIAVAVEIIKQPRLPGFHQFRHGDGGVYVGHRVMGVLVFNTVGDGQMFKPEARQPFVILWPGDPFRTQGIAGAHHVEQIPARVIVLPAPGIRVIEVAIEDIPRHFVIKAHVVIADDTGLRHREQIVDAAGKCGLIIPFGQRFLRRDPGDHHRLRLRQVIVSGFAVKHFGLAEHIQLRVGADGGELRRPVEGRAGAEGFIIVE